MKIGIYDTTLRDGAQRRGISFSVKDKLKIAEKLDELGIAYIEGGWPGSNPKELEFFSRAREELQLKNARLCAFGSTRRPGGTADADQNIRCLVEAATPAVTIFGKSWDFHVVRALSTTLEENLEMIRDTLSYLKSLGLEVIYDAEHFFDGYRNNPDYALQTILAAAQSGADTVVLCDTNGGMMPWELSKIIDDVRQAIDLPLGIHAHDDCGMGVANSLMAVQSGVTHIQGTINGYGERCGNANLCTIIPNLQLKMDLNLLTEQQLSGLTGLSRFVAELANMAPQENQPYVGRNAFSHKGGVHVDAVNKNPDTYEHTAPGHVGNRRRILISELAGRTSVSLKAKEGNIALLRDHPETREVLTRLKELEHQGYQFEGAEGSFELLILKAMNTYRSFFHLEGFRLIIEKRESGQLYAEATIKVRVGERQVHTAAEGNGPVNAMDNALRKALEEIYPELKEIKLIDYKVRVLDGKDGTGSKVRVLIESRDDQKTWGTVGVSPNIIQASWEALVDSLEYGLQCRSSQLAAAQNLLKTMRAESES